MSFPLCVVAKGLWITEFVTLMKSE